MTSITMLYDAYFQNQKRLKDYYQALSSNKTTIEK